MMRRLNRQIINAVRELSPRAYGLSVWDEVKAHRFFPVSLGRIHTALGRLEARGVLSSWLAHPCAERGGRQRRY